MQAIGLARNAPHPNAALLFADFMLSPEGAEMLNSFGRVPSSRKVDTVLDHVHSVLADPTVSPDEAKKWQKLWSELFLH
jgi:iron(III) transport system substrate-binding protein